MEGDEVSEVSDDSSSGGRDREESGGVESNEVVEGKCEVQQVRLRAVGGVGQGRGRLGYSLEVLGGHHGQSVECGELGGLVPH